MKEPGFKKIAIVGMGLIGGSVGMAVRKCSLFTVTGIARRKESIEKAVEIGAIDNGTIDMKQGVKGADFLIMAVPVGVTCKLIKQILPHLESGCIITDVGSTKREIVETVDTFLPRDNFFVGSHPLAGSEKTGIEAAKDSLFKNATCILTPGTKSSSNSVNSVKTLWEAIGMKVIIMKPEEHDHLLALTSHLPHLAAAAMVNLIADKDKDIIPVIASGFNDTTRIASSSPTLWRDICLSNKTELASALRAFRELLKNIEDSIRNEDTPPLMGLLEKGKRIRDALNKNQR